MTVRISSAPPTAGSTPSEPAEHATEGEPRLDRTGSDPLEAAAVRAGWLLVDAHERLGIEGAGRVFGHEIKAWHGYAKGAVPQLEPWRAGMKAIATGQTRGNQLRIRRVLDFARPTDHIFDIGCGRGLLCGLLLKDVGIAAYHGIDIVASHLDATREMLEANDFAAADVTVRVRDLYDLETDEVADTGATLMICCEVLEHVPDPEGALRAMAAALPQGADLMFSVPMNGRLESVWGHCTVFDVARLKGMVDGAGLYVHHVEPVANTWALIIASRDPEPSTRVREAPSRPPVDVSVPLRGQRDFVAVELADITASSRWVRRADCIVSPLDRHYMVCAIDGHVPDHADPGGQYGGVTFPVKGLSSLRFELEFRDFTQVRRVYVDLHHRNRRVVRWTWKPKQRELERANRRRFALRPGESSAQFAMEESGVAANAAANAAADVDRVEVFVQVKEATHAAFAIRAAYLP